MEGREWGRLEKAVADESSPACHLLLDSTGQVLEALGGCQALLGREAARLVGQPFTRFLQASQVRELLEVLWRSRLSGSWFCLLGSPRADPLRTLLVTARCLPGGGSGVLFHLALQPVEPVQDRLAGSPATRELNEDLFSGLPLGLLVADPGRKVVLANPAAEALFQVEPGGLVGRSLRRLLPVVSLRPAPRGWVSTRAQLLDGRTVPVDLTLLQGDGRLVVALRDLSETLRVRETLADIVEKERQRVGQELHDSLGQKMTGLAFLAQRLADELQREGSPAGEEAGRLAALVRDLLRGTRLLSRGLFAPALESLDLAAALEGLAEQVRELHGLECRLRLSSPRPEFHQAPVAVHLFRIAQEAVNNAIRHGKPGRLLLDLRGGDEDFDLRVEDDGRGLPPRPAAGGGIGLRSMRLRADLLGAALDILPRQGGGVVVRCWRPRAVP